MSEDARGIHDMGGLPAGPVDRHEHETQFWERRVDALMMLLGRKGHLSVDQLRHGIEGLGEGAYERMGYYERWIASIAETLMDSGLVTADELGRRIAEVQAREPEK